VRYVEVPAQRAKTLAVKSGAAPQCSSKAKRPSARQRRLLFIFALGARLPVRTLLSDFFNASDVLNVRGAFLMRYSRSKDQWPGNQEHG
jgi:hypothetical protein